MEELIYIDCQDFIYTEATENTVNTKNNVNLKGTYCKLW